MTLMMALVVVSLILAVTGAICLLAVDAHMERPWPMLAGAVMAFIAMFITIGVMVVAA